MILTGLLGPPAAAVALGHDAHLTDQKLLDVATRHRGHAESHRHDLPLVHPSGRRTRLAETSLGSLQLLTERRAWLTMFDVGSDPVLSEVAAGVRAALDAAGFAAVRRTIVSVVCSSPGGVTPAHMDTTDVLLLQVTGTKMLGTGRFARRDEEAAELRRRFGPRRENLRRLPEARVEWELGPGRGVFIPAYTPHWAVVGAETSVALSVAVTTPELARRERVHEADAAFLRRGLRLPAPGRSAVVDEVRLRALGVARRSGARRAARAVS